MSGEILTFTLAANGVQRLERAGQYFEVVTGDWPFSVDLYAISGQLTDTFAGIVSGFFVEDDYGSIVLRNGGVAQTVQLLLMDAKRGGTRRQPGRVNVIDDAFNRAKGGASFAWRGSCFPGAGQTGHLSLWNPAGSGRLVVLRSVLMGSVSAGAVSLMRASGPVVGGAAAIVNKRVGGGASAMVVNSQAAGVLGAGVATDPIVSALVPAGASQYLMLADPVVVGPGFGVLVQCEVVASGLVTTWEWYEE